MFDSSSLDFSLPTQEASPLFDSLRPSTVPRPLPPEPLHVVGRALYSAPEQGAHGFVKEVKDENRVVGTWTLDFVLPGALQTAPVARAVLHACAASGYDAYRSTSAFLDIQLWDGRALQDKEVEAEMYRRLAQGVLQCLRWLMNCLPDAWRLPAAPYMLRLLPPRRDAVARVDLGRVQDLLEDLLAATECVPGVALRVIHNGSRSGA